MSTPPRGDTCACTVDRRPRAASERVTASGSRRGSVENRWPTNRSVARPLSCAAATAPTRLCSRRPTVGAGAAPARVCAGPAPNGAGRAAATVERERGARLETDGVVPWCAPAPGEKPESMCPGSGATGVGFGRCRPVGRKNAGTPDDETGVPSCVRLWTRPICTRAPRSSKRVACRRVGGAAGMRRRDPRGEVDAITVEPLAGRVRRR